MTNPVHLQQPNSQDELTLPADHRQQYDLQADTTFHLVDLEGFFDLFPFEPQLPTIAQEFKNRRTASDLYNLRQLNH
ncbi:MAG: hypothetical protein IH585_17850 [Anaerolineaceae bacterium]|nr:hypothetical protein [Anaerolineaceae bacterium]